MKRTVWAALLLTMCMSPACEDENPCDRYIDYMCDCHGADEGFDCQEISDSFADADNDVQDSCALELSAQKDVDEEEDNTCTNSVAATAR
ncbi:MAG: hypothetical protein GWP91_13450 [Rhodobacterales bacterium]|nr:hypothetical protein [Rhodobacterales bacterium]